MKKTYVSDELGKVRGQLMDALRGLAALTKKLQVTPREGAEAAPLKRDCPACGKQIMAKATVCGYCWKKPAAWVAPVEPVVEPVVAAPPALPV